MYNMNNIWNNDAISVKIRLYEGELHSACGKFACKEAAPKIQLAVARATDNVRRCITDTLAEETRRNMPIRNN
jgi:hypothetical protein